MPGFDGTGPRGQGPFSGGGRGYCIGYGNSGFAGAGPGRGFGRGNGRGRAIGRGYGRRFAAINSGKPEVEFLREQAQAMQDEVAAINQRIQELEGK